MWEVVVGLVVPFLDEDLQATRTHMPIPQKAWAAVTEGG